MPWLNVPEERRTVFIKPPYVRGGGLLGGSSEPPKMSKLQALAAARKKKREEKKSEAPVEGKSTTPEKEAGPAPSAPPAPPAPSAPSCGVRPEMAVSAAEAGSVGPPALDGTTDSHHAPVVEKAQPSTFAQALFKSASETPQPHQQLYAPPWLAFTTDEALVEAFSKPSPDDVVQAAQSQGSRFARK